MKLPKVHSIAVAAGICMLICGLLSRVHAQTCSFTVTTVAFGTVDVTANANVNTSATVSITCTTSSAMALRVCVNFGIGSGGATNAANRFMKSGANSLTYGLFSNAARTTPWGSNFWAGGGASPVVVTFPSATGTRTQNRTVFGRVYSGQQTVIAGTYLSSFSSTDAVIQYGQRSITNCNLLPSAATTSFNVTATVPSVCTISATDLNFGTAGTLTANTDANTNLQPKCTNGTAYNTGLNGGLSGATDPTQRKMTKGSEFILYGLYRDAARTLPWGNTIGTDTLAGTGTGLAQSVPVFGRIPAQTTPSPGVYNDTIVVTLTY